MKSRLNLRNIMFVVVILVLLAASPSALRYAFHHGGLYLFSRQFLEDLPKRLTGPGRFRFVLQPAVAILLGVRAGIADARAGRMPYLLSMFFDGEHRIALMKEALSQLSTLIAMSVLLDVVSQFLILGQIFPGPALIVGPVLIATPYTLSRALANRAARVKRPRQHL